MSFRRTSPPKRLPSRCASGIRPPPDVPTYRASHSQSSKRNYSDSYKNSINKTPGSSGRFVLAPQLSPIQMTEQQRKYEVNGNCREENSDRRQLTFLEKDSSPFPRTPLMEYSVNSSLKKKYNSNGIYSNEAKKPSRNVYRVPLDGSNKMSDLNFVGYNILKNIKVTGIVDVTPSQWRLDIDPLSHCVEMQVRNIDPNVYPMRRLCRLIQKKMTHREGNDNVDTFQRSHPRRGSLIINKKENDHLQFWGNLPNTILLRGSTALADVINVDKLPSECNDDDNNNDGNSSSGETVVYFRWIEGPPIELIVDANSVTSEDQESEKNYDYNENKDDILSVNKPVPSSLNSQAQMGNGKNNCIYHDHEDNNYNDQNIIPPVSEGSYMKDGNNHTHIESTKKEGDISSNNIVHSTAPIAISPITYLQGPSILYRDP
ncbi:uncharacterized protein TM35_000032130 [Trypanosoma theileri]|uniref:Uncharacterized protein n=1 Tax=Trypanosoma theileri TaxID=67003 RepID=A0A1X0P7Q0_9TRYP|nr:uncharacterized protein TM35_000032130 [Trypanosoma theileri]ORC92460.1 hypothetical protein TM35_000032130 [Trypanosoma theileri]